MPPKITPCLFVPPAITKYVHAVERNIICAACIANFLYMMYALCRTRSGEFWGTGISYASNIPIFVEVTYVSDRSPPVPLVPPAVVAAATIASFGAGGAVVAVVAVVVDLTGNLFPNGVRENSGVISTDVRNRTWPE
jgi:hypothetical protein